MRVAIYARYSSENQSEKSIEDQVRVCRNYAKEHGFVVDEKNIFVDEAISGRGEGIQVIRDSADGIIDVFSKFENRIQEIVVEGNKAMVICRIEAVTAAGIPLESTGANYYQVENGKIIYMASFHDREPFVKAFPDKD